MEQIENLGDSTAESEQSVPGEPQDQSGNEASDIERAYEEMRNRVQSEPFREWYWRNSRKKTD